MQTVLTVLTQKLPLNTGNLRVLTLDSPLRNGLTGQRWHYDVVRLFRLKGLPV
jgi:hypothetical protein